MAANTAEFPKLQGVFYHRLLEWLHSSRTPDWYLEIGTAGGKSLCLSQAKSIAIDPSFKIQSDVIGKKPQLHLQQMTSDDFFSQGIAEKLGAKIDLAFLDGMHLFEYLLRDFIGTEKICTPGAMIVLHDCCPHNFAMANREWDRNITQAWTGDVWKLVPILRKYRPELKLTVLDCPPTGLVLVTGLDPMNRELERQYDKIVADYASIELNAATLAEYVVNLHLESAYDYTGLAKVDRSKRRPATLLERFYRFWW